MVKAQSQDPFILHYAIITYNPYISIFKYEKIFTKDHYGQKFYPALLITEYSYCC